MNVKIIFMLIVHAVASHVSAQNDTTVTKELLQRLLKSYNIDKPIQYNMTITQYDSSGQKIVNQTVGKTIKYKQQLYMKYDKASMVLQDSLMLYVVEPRKEMFLKKISKSMRDSINNYSVEHMIQVFQKNKIVIHLKNVSGNIQTYQLMFNNMPGDLYEIQVDKKNNYIMQIVMVYYDRDEKNHIVNRTMKIVYKDYLILKDKNLNLLKKFIKYHNGDIVPQDQYSDYQLKNI